MIFCDKIRQELMETKSKAFIISGGDKRAFKEVLEWIKDCASRESMVKFKELGDSTSSVFMRYAHAISAAQVMGIPAHDFANGLHNRMLAAARKVLMSWGEVEFFYYNNNHVDSGLRDVAAASIFWAWWTGKLDENETPQQMMFLDRLRKANPALDKDLHDLCAKNEADLRKKWAEANAKRDNGDGACGENGPVGGAAGADGRQDGRMDHGDWADEVNQHQQHSN